MKCTYTNLPPYQLPKQPVFSDRMVLQKPTRFKAKTKIKKTISTIFVEENDQKKLAGAREAVAIEVLHMMFLKEVAKSSNFVAFQKRKNAVDKKCLLQGIEKAMEKCLENNNEDENKDSDNDSGLSDD